MKRGFSFSFLFQKEKEGTTAVSVICTPYSFPYIWPGYWSVPSGLGCWASQGVCSWPQAETHRADHRQRTTESKLPCREIRRGQRKCSLHNEGNRIPSQRPFIWATMTRTLLLQCPVTFSWNLWLSPSLWSRAHLLWSISYLEGKKYLQLKEKSALTEWQWGVLGRQEGWFYFLASKWKGSSSSQANEHP